MTNSSKPFLILRLLLAATPALAHAGHTPPLPAFLAGFLHPLTGWDHLLTTLAVGLWAARLPHRARPLLPLTFLLAMTVGAVLATTTSHLLFTEHTLISSTITLMLLAASAIRPPLPLATLIVATLATFHGYAHLAERPVDAPLIPYAAGLLLATSLLLLTGLALGSIRPSRIPTVIAR
jgi:urease accessory protein